MDNTALLQRVQERKAKLKEAGDSLKAHFVGLDSIIDKILANIETWYIMPELITRPVIVCLFGPTGVGKTDLVRRLVKQLDFSDRYCEVELANKNNSWHRSIAGVFRESNRIESGKPSIVLLDEIQNFRTLDEEGGEIADYEMKDVWSLLSDGKLPYKVEIESLLSMLWDYSKKDVMAKTPKPVKVNTRRYRGGSGRKRPPVTIPLELGEENEEGFSYYQLNYFKSILRLDDPIEEIALWSDAKKKQMIIQRLMDKSIYEEEDYTKCLIFISGNLDEAYGYTKNAKEVDIDADILYEKSKKITILDIKEALGKRFRPEQISRMGNTQIIYPSLSRESFEVIIQRKINSIIQGVKKQTGIRLNVDSSINKLIYDNGVYPTQGTRPVFSTISEVLEAFLPDFLMSAMLHNVDALTILYENNMIVGKVNGEILRKPFVGNLDILRDKKQKNKNRKALAATHESAHAIVHAILFKLSPNQIVASPVSEDMEGFVYHQDTCYSKQMVKNRICVLLAGQEAEKIIFGEDNQTSGASDDLRKATAFASHMIRKWGMGGWASQMCEQNKSDSAYVKIEDADSVIENLIKEKRNEVRELLLKHRDLLIDVIENLMKFDKITPEEFKVICAKHGIGITVSSLSEDMVYWDYFDKFEEFKK